MENQNYIEKPKTRICKKWLVMERCSACLFEALCRIEENRKRNQQQEK